MFGKRNFNVFKNKFSTLLFAGILAGGLLCTSMKMNDTAAINKGTIKNAAIASCASEDICFCEHKVFVNGPGPIVTVQREFYYQIRSVTNFYTDAIYKEVEDYKNTTSKTWTNLGGTTYIKPSTYASKKISNILGTNYAECANELKNMTPYSQVTGLDETLITPIVSVGPKIHYVFNVTETRDHYVLTVYNTKRTCSWGKWSEWKIENAKTMYEVDFHFYTSKCDVYNI